MGDESTPDAVPPLPGWVVRTGLRPERVVWIAARPRLEKMHRKWWQALLATGGSDTNAFAPGSVTRVDNELASEAMQTAAVVVDELAGRMSPEEQDLVRRTGRLPEWFWPAFRSAYKSSRSR